MLETQQFLTREELAVYLRVTTKTLDRWRLDRDLPHLQLSPRKIRFRMSEVEKWINRKGKK